MKKIWLAAGTFLPFVSMAHPGHGELEGFTIQHYMVEPEHVVALVLILAVVFFFAGRKKEMKNVQHPK
jgi:5-enolpyruvylshikimate-3-phosphate synthase